MVAPPSCKPSNRRLSPRLLRFLQAVGRISISEHEIFLGMPENMVQDAETVCCRVNVRYIPKEAEYDGDVRSMCEHIKRLRADAPPASCEKRCSWSDYFFREWWDGKKVCRRRSFRSGGVPCGCAYACESDPWSVKRFQEVAPRD